MAINIEHFLNALQEEVKDFQVPVVDLIAVQTNDPYRILVATILSARTRDEVTAKAAAKLFKKASDPESLAKLMPGLQHQVGAGDGACRRSGGCGRLAHHYNPRQLVQHRN